MLRAPLYEIVTRVNATIAAFLSLPVGTKVLKKAHGLWISCNGRSHQIRRGPFLEHLMQAGSGRNTAFVSIDDSHDLLRWPPGRQIPCYLVPAAAHLNVRCQHEFTIAGPAEIRALGIQHPNMAVLLSKNVQWRESWKAGWGAEFDLRKAPTPAGSKKGSESNDAENVRSITGPATPAAGLAPGEELILIVGYSDSGPQSITHGGIAAMWSGRLRVA
jgi:hypothetical protein